MHVSNHPRWRKRLFAILCIAAFAAFVAMPCFALAETADDVPQADVEASDALIAQAVDDVAASENSAVTPRAAIETVKSQPGSWQNIPVYRHPLSKGELSPDVAVRAKLNPEAVPAGSDVYAFFDYGGQEEVDRTDLYSGFSTWCFITLNVGGVVTGEKVFDAIEVTLLRTPISGENAYIDKDAGLIGLTYATAANPIFVYITNNEDERIRYIADGSPITFTPAISGSSASFSIYAGYPVTGSGVTAPALTVTGDTGVKAHGNLQGPNIPAGADIKVDSSIVTSGEAFDALNKEIGDNRIGDIFDITLLVNGEEIHDGFGNLSISLPIDAKYNNHVIYIYHRHQDGTITKSETVAKDGFITFTVTNLSDFALADGGLAPSDENDSGDLPPKTGDASSLFVLFALAGVALASLRMIKSAKSIA